jgi:rod shape-determining protein MreC
MINDQTSGVGAMLEKSRLQGVLKGTPDGAVILERVMADEKVSPGDTVLSSGGDQIFPKGLPVGTVSKVSPGREMFLNIQVRPAADLSRLEEVLVVTEKQEQTAVVENGARVRAADILAQRLPSVPDKPVAAAAAVGAPGSSKVGAPGQSTSAAAKTQIPVTGSAKPGSVGVQQVAAPSTAAASTAKVASGASAVAPATAKPASTGRAPDVDGSAEPKASQAPKKTVPKVAGDSTASGGSPNAVGSNSASLPAKSSTVQPKLPVSQPNPQPPATDEDPH